MRPNRQRTERARELRQTQTPFEAKMWSLLRDRRLEGFKFRRQHPIDRFVADFTCVDAKLIIELDGNSHDDRLEQDAARDQFLRDNDWHTLRVRNADLLHNGEGVILTVLDYLSR